MNNLTIVMTFVTRSPILLPSNQFCDQDQAGFVRRRFLRPFFLLFPPKAAHDVVEIFEDWAWTEGPAYPSATVSFLEALAISPTEIMACGGFDVASIWDTLPNCYKGRLLHEIDSLTFSIEFNDIY